MSAELYAHSIIYEESGFRFPHILFNLIIIFFLTPLIHSTTLQSTSPLPSLSISIASPTTLRLFYNFIKCLSHFLVGYSEYISKFITVLYSEIARLIKEQFGTSTCNIGSLKNTILKTGKALKKHIWGGELLPIYRCHQEINPPELISHHLRGNLQIHFSVLIIFT